MVKSVCPYCAVGCGQNVYVKDEKVVQIEGDPDSPISRGRLCPKGSASLQLTTGERAVHKVLYRRPYATDWEQIDLDTAMDMVAERVIKTREETFSWDTEDGQRVRRTMGIAHLGGATLDNEENYLIKKLFTALGIVQVENQARVCHSSTVAGLGTSFGRGGGTTYMQDLQNSDCIVIEGSNFAEAHPVGFQWVMEAKARGAKVIHVDPRFSRTSALADVFVPIRAGTDIAWLGGLINYVLQNDKYFHDYVVNYTNAATMVTEDFRDTEDLDGVFSGLDREAPHLRRRLLAVLRGRGNGGVRVTRLAVRLPYRAKAEQRQRRPEAHGHGGPGPSETPHTDETLQDPRYIFQVLKRHYSRYTPEMVEQVCGVPQEQFLRVAELITENSNRDRTTAFAYAVGWTQHTVGVQYIRAACILQLLLGNIGRPGGGILALRGHASIQGSSDIPTLFDMLPGYIPMPHAHKDETLQSFIEARQRRQGLLGQPRQVPHQPAQGLVGCATRRRPTTTLRLPAPPHRQPQHLRHRAAPAQGQCKGYFLMGENPAVGSANTKMQRLGMANLEWLVVRDFSLIESATWWKDGPEIESGELKTEEIGTEVFFFPAASHTEKTGSFTNTNRMLQWRFAAVEPAGEARSDLWFLYHLGKRIREQLAGSTDERDRPVLDLTWDYPTEGSQDEPIGEAVLAEINGWDAEGKPLCAYADLKADGTTACGCWIYCGVYKDGVNQAARRKPAKRAELGRAGVGAGPGRPTGARSTAGPAPTPTATRGASARPWSGGTRSRTSGSVTTSSTSRPTSRRTTGRTTTPRASTRSAASTRSSCSPTARAGSSRRSGSSTARCRRTTSRRSPRSTTRSTPSRATRSAGRCRTSTTATRRAASFPGARGLPVRRHDLPAHRALHRRRHDAAGSPTSPSCSPRCSSRSRPSWRPSAGSRTAAGQRLSPRAAPSRRGCW